MDPSTIGHATTTDISTTTPKSSIDDITTDPSTTDSSTAAPTSPGADDITTDPSTTDRSRAVSEFLLNVRTGCCLIISLL